MISAKLGPGGLNQDSPCVYVLQIITEQESWLYIGRTGTSNKTGISSPYKRLAKHLAKVGSTQSCIWDNSHVLSPEVLQSATIRFEAVPIPLDYVSTAEQWLLWKFREQHLLNKERKLPSVEPKIEVKIRDLLAGLIQTIEKKG
jgi:hypothetical protein